MDGCWRERAGGQNLRHGKKTGLEVQHIQPGAKGNGKTGGLFLRQRLREAKGALALFPLAALLHHLHALETLEDTALGADRAATGLETGMLRHKKRGKTWGFGARQLMDVEGLCNGNLLLENP